MAKKKSNLSRAFSARLRWAFCLNNNPILKNRPSYLTELYNNLKRIDERFIFEVVLAPHSPPTDSNGLKTMEFYSSQYNHSVKSFGEIGRKLRLIARAQDLYMHT